MRANFSPGPVTHMLQCAARGAVLSSSDLLYLVAEAGAASGREERNYICVSVCLLDVLVRVVND